MKTMTMALALGLPPTAHAKDTGLPICDLLLFDEKAVDEMDPADLYGDLFRRVQTARLFKDSKTFVDMEPRFHPSHIMTEYLTKTPQSRADLREFVEANFLPLEIINLTAFHSTGAQNPAEYIRRLWPLLTRPPTGAPAPGSSLIEINTQYVAPGGRFRELYYWDSYFTQLGLLADQQTATADAMVRIFSGQLKRYGRIHNGNRDYYRDRSQPPFFAAMVSLWQDRYSARSAAQFLPAMITEHHFWMGGPRAIPVENGVLNRYWNDQAKPRSEAFHEDVELAELASRELGRAHEDVYRDLGAGAESGWDFSTRWFADPGNFATIQTTALLPVDLNSLMWNLENKIAELSRAHGDAKTALRFQQLADRRARMIRENFYDVKTGTFRDINWRTGKLSPEITLAMVAPLFFGIATNEQAQKVLDVLERDFLKTGGLKTTLRESGQQWDGRKGWAPLQWMAYVSAIRYQRFALAEKIRTRWLHANDVMFALTGEMKEKYDVENLTAIAGGGEYEPQFGFGWSNGVYKAFLNPKPLLKHILGR